MADIIRDAPIGQIIRWLTKNKYFQYPEEKPGFKLPDPWVELINNPDSIQNHTSSDASTLNHDEKETSPQTPINDDEQPLPSLQVSHSHVQPNGLTSMTSERLAADDIHAIERVKSIPIVPRKTKDGTILVDWYYTDDAENPYNWSNNKRGLITVIIALYTFVVYTSSAIYTTSSMGIMKEFGVSQLKASLGLSLYVLGYGIGPLIFSPLSEIPRIGRNPVYIITMFLFVIISIPTAFAQNYPGLMVLRFLQGFFGSPCLASGGASMGDMFSLMSLPYAMMAWVSAAYCGRKSFLLCIYYTLSVIFLYSFGKLTSHFFPLQLHWDLFSVVTPYLP